MAIRLTAAAVWIIAGVAKIPQIQTFEVLVQRYGILPDALSGPFAYVLPFLMLAFPARALSLDRRLFGAVDLFGELRSGGQNT